MKKTRGEKKVRMILYLPRDLYEKLCIMATKLGISRSELVCRLLTNHLENDVVTKSFKDVPFEKLAVGDNVISIFGKNGKIAFLDPQDDNFVLIVWEDGRQSGWYHPDWDERILYVGR